MMRSVLIKLAIGIAVLILAAVAYVVYAQWDATSKLPIADTEGRKPRLVEAAPQWVPGVRLVDTIGWGNEAPKPAKGLAVTRFADDLDHPRTMLTLPNGDVLVAETSAPAASKIGGLTGMVANWMMDKVGANVPSPDKIVLLRDTDGDGKADKRFDFRTDDMVSPSGMAFGDGRLYIANHDAVLAWTFEPGPTKLVGKPRRIMNLPEAGQHWMRNLLLSPDGKHLYVAVGSATNIADKGMDAETGRAAIWEIDADTGRRRQFAGGMRNPNGMGWSPWTQEMWATVQERDMLGPDLVPDYFTNVPVGAQYGWPWVYWKDVFDDRVQWNMQSYMIEYTRKPEYAMGAHTAVLGMVFSGAGNRMGADFSNGAFIARHGSWNRNPAVGYDVVYVPFDANGNPKDAKPLPVLTGFLTEDGKHTRGRPTWLAWDKSGGLLVSDDTSGVIWRVAAPGADAAPAIKPVVTAHLKPLKEIKTPEERAMIGGFKAEDDRLLP